MDEQEGPQQEQQQQQQQDECSPQPAGAASPNANQGRSRSRRKPGAKKTPRGQGYTVRVNGRKQNTSAVLEAQLSQIEQRFRELQQQNDLLKEKESMQLAMLESYELGLHHMGTAAATTSATPSGETGGGPSASGSQRLGRNIRSAVVLDMQALELMQVLQPQLQGACNSPQPQQPNRPSGSNSTGSSSSASGGLATNSSSGLSSGLSSGSGSTAPAQQNRMKRLLSSVTPADVQRTLNFTVEEFAGLFREAYAKLAVVRQASLDGDEQAAEGLGQAVDEVGRLAALSLVSNEDRHCRLIRLNYETLQHEEPPPGWWANVAQKANLLPEQRQQISACFQAFAQQRTALLQEQHQCLQALQAIMGAEASPQQLLSTDAVGAGAGAGGAGPEKSAGPAQLLSQLAQAGLQDPAAAAAGWPFGAAQEAVAGAGMGAHPLAAAAAGAPSMPEDLLLPPCTPSQPQPAATNSATPSCSSSSRAGSGGIGTESAAPGVLSLEDAERAEVLLQGLGRVGRLLKQHSRRATVHWINLLSAEQHADAMLAAWPWLTSVPALCAHVVQAELQTKQTKARRGAGGRV